MSKKTSKRQNPKKEDSGEIPGMNLENNYSPNKAVMPDTSDVQKRMDKTKKDLEKLKGKIIEKYGFIKAMGILPQQAVKQFVEDELGEGVQETELKKLEKKIHLYIIIPEEKFKERVKIKKGIVDLIDKSNQDVWAYLKTPVDIWEACMDSKFDLVNFIGLSYPLHDTGILSALRVAEIHKNLVLQKFDKYVVSYVVGGSLVRGNVTKTSDVDCFVIINDTDVKKMPRLELKERLRTMIYRYISEASALAGLKKNVLNVQIYLLTDFWEAVKDAHPVMFTFIRDGVPLYDKGTFLPWKALLKMGRLKPSPEAIDMFMKTAEKTSKLVDKRLLDAMVDLYYKVLNPSQALIMLYGSPPPTHKETPKLMEKIFVTKEKLLKKSEVAVLKTLVEMFREYEHNPKMSVKGSKIDKLVKDSDEYIKRLEKLRVEIEERSHGKTINQLYEDIFGLLEGIISKKSENALVKEFDELVKEGKFAKNHAKVLKDVVQAKKDMGKKTKKLKAHKVDKIRKNASRLINELIEYSQRAEMMELEKSRMRIKYKEKGKSEIAEILHTNSASFLFVGNSVKKITDKIEASDMKEVSAHVEEQKKKGEPLEIKPRVFDLIKKELGEFELIL